MRSTSHLSHHCIAMERPFTNGQSSDRFPRVSADSATKWKDLFLKTIQFDVFLQNVKGPVIRFVSIDLFDEVGIPDAKSSNVSSDVNPYVLRSK